MPVASLSPIRVSLSASASISASSTEDFGVESDCSCDRKYGVVADFSSLNFKPPSPTTALFSPESFSPETNPFPNGKVLEESTPFILGEPPKPTTGEPLFGDPIPPIPFPEALLSFGDFSPERKDDVFAVAACLLVSAGDFLRLERKDGAFAITVRLLVVSAGDLLRPDKNDAFFGEGTSTVFFIAPMPNVAFEVVTSSLPLSPGTVEPTGSTEASFSSFTDDVFEPNATEGRTFFVDCFPNDTVLAESTPLSLGGPPTPTTGEPIFDAPILPMPFPEAMPPEESEPFILGRPPTPTTGEPIFDDPIPPSTPMPFPEARPTFGDFIPERNEGAFAFTVLTEISVVDFLRPDNNGDSFEEGTPTVFFIASMPNVVFDVFGSPPPLNKGSVDPNDLTEASLSSFAKG
mmetsp:Transcript_6056/g.13460  ORF Transcript_6056/g.13460 Transcript_6056/m.13460 type:complete len:405 (-) Transcript_6056:214-1428(-)